MIATACTQAISGDPHGSPSASAPSPSTPSSASSSGSVTPGPSPSTSLPPAPTPQPIGLQDCTTRLEAAGVNPPAALRGKLQLFCGQMQVPLDYAHPDGKQITMTVLRMHDTENTTPIGSLLTNPGGPGASGLDFSLDLLTEISPSILKKFDLIGFDPRGVGESTPITCLTTEQKDTLLASAPDVTTSAGFIEANKDEQSVAEACESKYGSALPFFNTENTARDMDQLRRALGDDQMNYLGFSYGTELGWVYAHLFPSKVRAVVLDGAVDPDTSGIAQFAEQVQGFEDAFDQFADYCRTVSPCDELSNPRATVLQLTAAARSHPLSTGSSRTLTYSLAFTGVLQALYSKSLWPRLASALIGAVHGDGSGLLQLADQYNERLPSGGYTNVLDANTTISCNDSAPGPTDATVRKTAADWVKQYPLFGRWLASSLFGCQDWQPDRTPIPKPKAATPTKVLVIGNLHDPATPYQGAKDLARDLGNARLLSWDGEGHTSYLRGSSCIDDYVNAYLLTTALPPNGKTCPK